ncbi:hypothetical protein VZT92_022524 [Zoarces viviparus]|uniref:Uncharacterized protein n=1 Tax=Zoarces viviparus TaxID=48416 RepID=A0AAW1EDX7_ZOAVI
MVGARLRPLLLMNAEQGMLPPPLLAFARNVTDQAIEQGPVMFHIPSAVWLRRGAAPRVLTSMPQLFV